MPLTSLWRRACYDVTKLADASEVQFVGKLEERFRASTWHTPSIESSGKGSVVQKATQWDYSLYLSTGAASRDR